jgi:predicted ATPase
MRVGRPPKVLRQLSVTSNKIIDRALELMVLQGLAKTKEKAATLLLNSAANKFIKNNLKIVSSMSLDNMLDAHEIDENGEED